MAADAKKLIVGSMAIVAIVASSIYLSPNRLSGRAVGSSDSEFEEEAEEEVEPTTVPFQGFLTDSDGTPVDGLTTLSLQLFDSRSATEALFSETQQIEILDGWFDLEIGSTTPLALDLVVDHRRLYLEVVADDGEPLLPRFELGSVVKAVTAKIAQDARSLAGSTPDAFLKAEAGPGLKIDENGVLSVDRATLAGWFNDTPEVLGDALRSENVGGPQIPEPCAEGEMLTMNGGAWTCAADPLQAMGAGPGLSREGSTLHFLKDCDDGQIPVFGGGAWKCADDEAGGQLEAGDGMGLSGTEVGLLPGCAQGQIPKFGDAGWGCANDRDTAVETRYTAGDGMTLDDATIGLLQGCADGQILKFSTTAGWQCRPDDDAGPELRGTNGIAISEMEISFLPDCAQDQIPRANAQGEWTCGVEEPPVEVSYSAGTGITKIGDEFSLLQGCSVGQIPRYEAQGWTCGEDTFLQSGDGIVVSNGVAQLLPGCSVDQIPRVTAAGTWACGDPDQLTTAAGSGLQLQGSTLGFLPGCEDGQIPVYGPDDGWQCADDQTLDETAVDTFLENNDYASTESLAETTASVTALAASIAEMTASIDAVQNATSDPVGTIAPFHPNVVTPAIPVPYGWHPCDGSAIAAVEAYADGGIAAGLEVGSVNAPDLNGSAGPGLKGRFLRGSTDNPGVDQDHAMESHTHGHDGLAVEFTSHNHARGNLDIPSHNHTTTRQMLHFHQRWGDNGSSDNTYIEMVNHWGIHQANGEEIHAEGISDPTVHQHGLTGASAEFGGSETRPASFSVVWIIKIF